MTVLDPDREWVFEPAKSASRVFQQPVLRLAAQREVGGATIGAGSGFGQKRANMVGVKGRLEGVSLLLLQRFSTGALHGEHPIKDVQTELSPGGVCQEQGLLGY